MRILRDHGQIEQFLRHNAPLNIYSLGDLDPFFWPRTRWYGSFDGPALREVFLLYRGPDPPTLLALRNGDDATAAHLMGQLGPHLPDEVYAHLSPGLEAALAATHRTEPHGRHLKLALVHTARLEVASRWRVEPLGERDLPALLALYEEAYPGNWFDPRMLRTGHYLGVREGGRLVCVAGVHVYAPSTRVAALGNVTTLPHVRGRGIARAAVAALCVRLLRTVDTVGLNVHADNAAALALYRRLGFEPVAEYREFAARRR